MDSFEWMELQTLISDITASRTRLATARSSEDHRRARVLEAEIDAAENRRAQLLVHITTHLAGAPDGAAHPAATQGADLTRAVGPIEETLPDEAERERQSLDLVEEIVGDGAASPAAAPRADSAEGGIVVWDQLTPSDIERATNELGVRRAAMLARHAEDLNRLDADQTQIETLEQAIDAFVRKLNLSSAEPAVVELWDQRAGRLQGRG